MESSLPLPYDIVEESDWNYSFKTKHGIVYHAYFIDFSIYHPTFDNVYTFNIEPESDRPHPIDNRIAMTIVSLLRIFFSRNDHAMIMVCDNLDGKEKKSDWTSQLYRAETSESVQKKRSYDFVSIVSSFRCAGSECSKASCKEYSV